jgi:uncharacterized protein (DUF697 family)
MQVAKLPLNLSKALDAWKEVSGQTAQSAGVTLAGDPRLVGLAQQRFSSGGTVPATWVGPAARLVDLSPAAGEILIMFVPAEGETEARSALAQSTVKRKALIAVDEGSGATGKSTYLGNGLTRLSFSDTPAGWQQVFAACAQAAGSQVVALGRRYPVLRDATARQVVYRTAGQNALVGLAFFVPGADMPAMTLNQLKMVLSLANVYGEAIDRERAVELVGVVGLGFGLRALTRYLVRSTSGIGWALKGVTGFAATMAMGMAAAWYFEKGAPASTSRVVALAGSLKH